jgi:hypothetical protein
MLLLSSRRTPEGFLPTRAVMARLHVDQAIRRSHQDSLGVGLCWWSRANSHASSEARHGCRRSDQDRGQDRPVQTFCTTSRSTCANFLYDLKAARQGGPRAPSEHGPAQGPPPGRLPLDATGARRCQPAGRRARPEAGGVRSAGTSETPPAGALRLRDDAKIRPRPQSPRGEPSRPPPRPPALIAMAAVPSWWRPRRRPAPRWAGRRQTGRPGPS